MIRLYDELIVLRDKNQKVNIKDGNDFVVSDALVGDVPMKYTKRNVFGVFVEDGKTVTITLENMKTRQPVDHAPKKRVDHKAFVATGD